MKVLLFAACFALVASAFADETTVAPEEGPIESHAPIFRVKDGIVMKNIESDMVLSSEGHFVKLDYFLPTPYQLWYPEYYPEGKFRFRNKQYHMYLAYAGKLENSARLVTVPNDESDNKQYWMLNVDHTIGTFEDSSMVIDIPGSNYEHSEKMIVYKNNGNKNQKFRVIFA